MKLRSRLMLFTAVMALSTGMAAAAITRNDVVTTYQTQGYTYIEVKDGLTQIKVEAIKGSTYIEVVYDKASGEVVSTESGTASAEDAAQTGLSVSTVDRDFEVGDDEKDDDDAVEIDDEDEVDVEDNDDADEDENDADEDDAANEDDHDGDDDEGDDDAGDDDENDGDENDGDESDGDESDGDDDDNSGGDDEGSNN